MGVFTSIARALGIGQEAPTVLNVGGKDPLDQFPSEHTMVAQAQALSDRRPLKKTRHKRTHKKGKYGASR